MRNFRDIIDAWPSRSAFADDIGSSQQAVTNMVARDSIPSRYWVAIVHQAEARGITGVTFDLLAKIAAGSTEAAA